jgi:hypothetical protein
VLKLRATGNTEREREKALKDGPTKEAGFSSLSWLFNDNTKNL